MKLLLDNNLSFRLIQHLQIHFPQSNHIRNNVGVSADDETIWNYAKQNDFIILTKTMTLMKEASYMDVPPKSFILFVAIKQLSIY